MKLCKCGAIVKDRCLRCYPMPKHARTTKERGYGWDHQQASVRYREEHPLCEACVWVDVIGARPSTSMHHIHKITDAPQLRMQRSNWLALCEEHHSELEDDTGKALACKRWSERHYEEVMERPNVF